MQDSVLFPVSIKNESISFGLGQFWGKFHEKVQLHSNCGFYVSAGSQQNWNALQVSVFNGMMKSAQAVFGDRVRVGAFSQKIFNFLGSASARVAQLLDQLTIFSLLKHQFIWIDDNFSARTIWEDRFLRSVFRQDFLWVFLAFAWHALGSASCPSHMTLQWWIAQLMSL